MKAMWLVVLRRVLFSLALVFLAGAAFVAGAWLARATGRDPRPLELPTTPSEQVRRARDLVEEALAARLAGENTRAIRLFDEAAKEDVPLRGLDYQRGLTYFFDGRLAEAEEAARVSLSAGEHPANAYALLVMCAAGRAAAGEETDPRQVAEWAASARAKDPLAPFVHYAMGEYSRAIGQPREAVEHYRKALERVSPTDSLLVSTVKAGLSGLRLRQHSEPKPVIPSISDQGVPPEWLFFAAAQALLDKDPGMARAYLQRAREALPPEVFSALLKDSFFQDYLPEDILSDPQ